MKPLKEEIFVCIDCETTGLDLKKDKIIEVACVVFTLDKILAEYETLIDPECEISSESLAIHNIHPHMLEGKPKIGEILPQIFSMANKHIIVGHGIGFDIDMLNNAAKSVSIHSPLLNPTTIDTVRLARSYGDSPNNSLSNLAKHFNVEIEGVAHRAMTDVKMNVEVFRYLARRYKTVHDIFGILSRPIKMKYMPLGKYKGRLFSELPLNYLLSTTRLDFDQDLRYSIQLELKKRKQGGLFSQATNPFQGL